MLAVPKKFEQPACVATSFTADPSGFGDTISEVSASTSKNYAYRSDDMLNAVQAGSTQAAYYFDALGRRAAKVVNQGGQSFTQAFAYIGQDNSAFLGKAGDGSITTYLDGQGPNEHLAEVKGGTGKGYVTDHIGSVLNGDAAGSTHGYGLFGEIAGSASISPVSDPLVFGFAGMPLDLESGQYQAFYRQYNPLSRRWLSQDPIGLTAEDPNYYRYVFNAPLGAVDPTGTEDYKGFTFTWPSDFKAWAATIGLGLFIAICLFLLTKLHPVVSAAIIIAALIWAYKAHGAGNDPCHPASNKTNISSPGPGRMP